MNEYKELLKIAEGNQAEIYSWGDNKVLRLYRDKGSKNLADWEMLAMKTVSSSGVRVPRVYEYVEIMDRPGFILERIYGKDMLDSLSRNPFSLFQTAKEFAEIQFKTHQLTAPAKIINLKIRIKKFVESSDLLTSQLKNFILSLLEELPDGDRLCHGDFQPGNILIENGEPMLIDWCGVAAGDPVSDIAHTMILLKNSPLPPNIPLIIRTIIKLMRKTFASFYLKYYNRLNHIDRITLSKWEAVRSAERLYFGMKGESRLLIDFIERYFKSWEKGEFILL